MKNLTKAQILAELGEISSMEKGKLSPCSHRPTSKAAGYCRLQRWENGKNVSKHVTPDQVPALQEAIAGYQRGRELTDRYLDLVVAETRARLAGDSKKKPRPHSSDWPGKPRSRT